MWYTINCNINFSQTGGNATTNCCILGGDAGDDNTINVCDSDASFKLHAIVDHSMVELIINGDVAFVIYVAPSSKDTLGMTILTSK